MFDDRVFEGQHRCRICTAAPMPVADPLVAPDNRFRFASFAHPMQIERGSTPVGSVSCVDSTLFLGPDILAFPARAIFSRAILFFAVMFSVPSSPIFSWGESSRGLTFSSRRARTPTPCGQFRFYRSHVSQLRLATSRPSCLPVRQ